MVNKNHFGKRISVLRRRAGLSQADVAEKPAILNGQMKYGEKTG